MITRKIHAAKADAWRTELRDAITDLDELLRAVGLTRDAVHADASPEFALRVPRAFVAKMRRGDADDPLLRQVLPLAQENIGSPSQYVTDPLHEGDAVMDAGLLQKYQGRVLLLASPACAVHCRYCFRRHFPYDEHRQSQDFAALRAVAADPGIREVILSGGDPLTLTDAHFARLVEAVEAIPHVTRLRIHTRLPVVIPNRVTPELAELLASTRLACVVVLHVNHANEIGDDVAAAAERLGAFTLLNQSVLLAGVNDSADALVSLSERLFDIGVLPYYLHLPDAVRGTAHFDVDEARALALHEAMAARLPGYLLPRLVRERPGRAAKELLTAPVDHAAP